MKFFVKSLINLQFSLSVGKTFGEVSIKKEDGGFGASLIGRNTKYVVKVFTFFICLLASKRHQE
jgi:hypothetical protein